MSDFTTSRIAELRHKRVQAQAHRQLTSLSKEIGEDSHEPVEFAVSLALQKALYELLDDMRHRGELRKVELVEPGSATLVLEENLGRLGDETVFAVLSGARGSGFFRGRPSSEFQRACLRQGYDGIIATRPDLKAGVVLDVVDGDPVLGDYYEVEWW